MTNKEFLSLTHSPIKRFRANRRNSATKKKSDEEHQQLLLEESTLSDFSCLGFSEPLKSRKEVSTVYNLEGFLLGQKRLFLAKISNFKALIDRLSKIFLFAFLALAVGAYSPREISESRLYFELIAVVFIVNNVLSLIDSASILNENYKNRETFLMIFSIFNSLAFFCVQLLALKPECPLVSYQMLPNLNFGFLCFQMIISFIFYAFMLQMNKEIGLETASHFYCGYRSSLQFFLINLVFTRSLGGIDLSWMILFYTMIIITFYLILTDIALLLSIPFFLNSKRRVRGVRNLLSSLTQKLITLPEIAILMFLDELEKDGEYKICIMSLLILAIFLNFLHLCFFVSFNKHYRNFELRDAILARIQENEEKSQNASGMDQSLKIDHFYYLRAYFGYMIRLYESEALNNEIDSIIRDRRRNYYSEGCIVCGATENWNSMMVYLPCKHMSVCRNCTNAFYQSGHAGG